MGVWGSICQCKSWLRSHVTQLVVMWKMQRSSPGLMIRIVHMCTHVCTEAALYTISRLFVCVGLLMGMTTDWSREVDEFKFNVACSVF